MAARPRAIAPGSQPSRSTLSGSPSTAPLDSISPSTRPTAAPTIPVPSRDRLQAVLMDGRLSEDDSDSDEANRARGEQGKRKRRERIPEERFVHVKRDELGWTRHLEERQWQLPHAQGYPNCNYQDNSVFTCYPESNTTLVQGDYSLVIWNAMQPAFINRQAVDVYLYNADTQVVATSWTNEPNAQGMIGIVPGDPWWPGPQSAQEWFGTAAQNRTTPYFFVVVPAGSSLTGGEVHGATFRAIQTAAPSSLSSTLAALTSSSLSSQSSVSASSASAASASASASAASSRAASPSGTGTNGSLQNNSDSSPRVPKWGIALIVILGVLALVAGAAAVFLCLGRARKRKRAQAEAGAAGAAGAGATDRVYYDDDDLTQGSADPILGGAAGAGGGAGAAAASSSIGGASRMRSVGSGSSLAPALVGSAAGVGAGAGLGALVTRRPESHEGAIEQHDDGTTLSTSDAARMAEAFRAALRKSPFNLGGTGAAATASAAGLAADAAEGTGAGSTRPPGPSPTGAEKGDDSHGSSGDSSAIGLGAGRALLVNELQGEGKSMKDVEGGGGKRWGSR